MDLSAILPLLLKAQGNKTENNRDDNSDGGGDSESAEKNTGAKKSGGLNPADLLAMMSAGGGGGLDRDSLLKSIMPAGNNNIAQIMSLATSMNQNNNRPRVSPAGIRPIKSFANNDVIGKLVKFFQ